MNAPAKRMTAHEFAAWAERQTGRFELLDGLVVQMNAERLGHARVKHRIVVALAEALRKSGLEGEVYPDGVAVKVSEKIVHEPDAVLRLGPGLPDDTLLIADPTIVVEVLSPSTGPIDTSTKLANYFTIPSVAHYLIVNTVTQSVSHYSRGQVGRPSMVTVSEGELVLEPPGLSLKVNQFFAPADRPVPRR